MYWGYWREKGREVFMEVIKYTAIGNKDDFPKVVWTS